MLRIATVQALLHKENLQAIIVDNPVDLLYLTGMELSLGRLVIDEKGAHLFVDGRYYETCHSQLPFSVILSSGFDSESPFGSWWKFAGMRVGFNAETTPYAEYERLALLHSELVPLRHPIRKIRAIKEEGEIATLRGAAALCSRGYEYSLTLLQEGISEKEVARRLELFWIREGGDRLAFAPHIAFGEGSSQPHYHVSDRRLKKGDVVLIDIGVVCDHYFSDMTRVVSYGTPNSKLAEIYLIVYEAYQAATALCRPGLFIVDIDRAARDYIGQKGYKDYFTHGLGHGVGLEIHELPTIRSTNVNPEERLEKGMVITIEPGIYLPSVGGVRLENTLLITDNGFENLTQPSFPSFLPSL